MVEPAWKTYERQIADRIRSRAAPDAAVTFDMDGQQTLRGRFSRIDRQIDVIVCGRFAGLDGTLRMIVDCKCWGRKVDVPAVEAFGGLVDDVGAPLGLLVTTLGYSDAAKRRAEGFRTVQLDVVPFDELAAWRPRRPTVAITAGTNTATLSYWEAGQLHTELVDPDLARRVLEDRTEPGPT